MIFSLLGRAILSGCVAGIVASVLQLWFVQPVLLHAELFEAGELVHFGQDGHAAGVGHATGSGAGGHGHDGAESAFGRNVLTAAFLVLVYSGFAFVLLALMSVAENRGAEINPRTGMIWGVAGFVVAILAPAFSAPPALPGYATIDIDIRQIWWISTVIATALGLWLIAFGQQAFSWVAGIMLLAAPHAIGLPPHEVFLGPAPPELGALMSARVIGTGMAAWVVMGAVAGYLWARGEANARTQPA
ncbi:cobalt transporter [Alphaproteobacteria bacterium GH1-50]|uniref:Cobalt transporter n=1 Tax=Kangsaoukella pontilimi TaxID=2691042 RepID=A0A7C9ISX6_9RHOB|nr:CbtA family protein [Kangsaoukella pontilimi]MXQ09066.1 cobalt transporter [Kangsaoukella pontilimi]